jgi:hypothetical protein
MRGAAWSGIVASIQPPCTPTAALTGCRLLQDGGGDGLADGQGQVVDDVTGYGGRQLLQASRTVRRSPARQVGDAARRFPSYGPLPALRPSWPGGGSCRPG